MPPTLYLIDGHALAYRTYFALMRGSPSGFTTSKGEPTAGIFGFTSVLLRILEQERPDYLAVAFDTGKTFRDELYPDYKGTRAKMPDDLRSQIERIRELVDAFNLPRLELENYEADDVLGSVARWAVTQGLGVKIITGDRDLLQLVDERIIVNLPGKSLADARDFLPEDVVEYLGVLPTQVVDFKALVGDKSDNIPGVAGVGEKTAISLLQSYGTLDGIYAHIAEISGSLHNKLEAGRENAYLSQTLAQIVTNLQITLDLQQARPQIFDPAKLEALFRELEFRSLMVRFNNLKQAYGIGAAPKGQQLDFFAAEQPVIQPASTPAGEIKYQVIDTPAALTAAGKPSGKGEQDLVRYRNNLYRPDARRSGGHLPGSRWRSGILHPGRSFPRPGRAAPPCQCTGCSPEPADGRPYSKDRPQPQIRLRRPGALWLAREPAFFRHHDCRVADQSHFSQSRLEEPGLGQAGLQNDRDRGADRQGVKTDHHGRRAGCPGSRLCQRRCSHCVSPDASIAG